VDRIIQQAIAQVLGPIFDPEFSASSFGFRPGRSAHHAIKQIQRYIKARYRVAVDLDLAKFFDRVSHDALMARVARKVRDKAVLRLIGKYLRAGVLVGEDLQPTETGVPQGSPLSRCCQTSCSTTWIRNWNDAATTSPATVTTFSSWSTASGRASASKPV
jgi:RNA-directed DNA polymerase